jgi:hypothetical protein
MVALGCSPAKPAVVDPPPYSRGTRECPLGFVGAHVTIDDTPDGAVFTFTTDERVAELRERVATSAAMYGPGAHRGLGHGGEHGLGQKHGLALSELPVTTAVETIEHGARLRVLITDFARRAEVRQALHERAERVAAGECP